MEESTDEPVGLVERACAIDIGKAGLVVCVRVPHESKPGRRVQEVREYATTTPALLGLADWLHDQHIELVAMEATSDFWKPVFYLLEAAGFECRRLNAKHVKNVPGRPKTDKLDAVWLAKVVERGMCRPSLVQPVIAAQDSGQGTTFAASRVYQVAGTGQYLLLSQAFGPDGHGYLRSWTATSIAGSWTSLADTPAAPFAGAANVAFPGSPWTSDFVRGELVRAGVDQSLTVNPCQLRLLYLGLDHRFQDNRTFLIGLLTQTNSTCN
jgi:hypothetical protein